MFNELIANLSNLFSFVKKTNTVKDKDQLREEALNQFLHLLEIKRLWDSEDYIEVNSTFHHYKFMINGEDYIYGISFISEILDYNLYSSLRLCKLLYLDNEDVCYIHNEECWTLNNAFEYIPSPDKSEGEGWFDIYRKTLEGSSLHKAVYNAMKIGRNEFFKRMINSEDFKKLKREYKIQHKVADF